MCVCWGGGGGMGGGGQEGMVAQTTENPSTLASQSEITFSGNKLHCLESIFSVL